jgi:hypothetical protein
MGSSDRATTPRDLGPLAREALARAAEANSDVRPALRMDGVPWLVVTYDELRELPLDHRAGYIVSLIDGRSTVEMIVDIAALPEGEARVILGELRRLGAIEVR